MQKSKILNNKKLTITLFIFIFFTSIIFTIIQTAFVIKNDYDKSTKLVEKSINQIKNNRLESISMAIWQLDNSQLKIIVDSILKLPGITYIEIMETNSKPIGYGEKKDKYIIEDTFDLTYSNLEKQKLGTIYVQGSYEDSIEKIYKEITEKILLETLKVFSIAIVLIFIVQKLIIRHLADMANYTTNLDRKKLSVPLVLHKKTDEKNPDFIDIVANAINTMRENLIKDIEKQDKQQKNLELTNERLEKEIEIRTKIEQDALAQKERIQRQYNTIVKLTLDEKFFTKTFKEGIYFLLKECAKTLDVDRVSYWQFEDNKNLRCTYRYLIEEDIHLEEDKVINTSKLPKFIDTLKKYKIIDAYDVYTDKRTIEYNKDDMKKVGIKSMLDVGVNFHGDMYGVIVFDTLKKQKMWTQDEISFVSRVSDQISNLLLINEWKKIKDEISEINNNLEITVEKRTKELKENIENLKIAQEQLVESEKMASLGGLVAGVAHEINTPVGISLTGITHFQYITKELKELYEKDNLSQEEFEKYINTSYEIANSVYKSLIRAAEQIKSFKQVAVDQSNEQIRDFNIKEYIEEVLLSLHNRLKKTKHNINIHCDDKLTINSYPGSFSQILTNFIMNSLIHGFKEIKKGNIDIYVKKIDNKIEIIYQDDGKGMNKNILKKIFDPFFTTNRDNGGSGLGLNIVYNIVTNGLNGTIKATSEIDKGLKFIITFPVK
jgi:signal transduction histidine kinase